jgi:hypothetical protein
MLVSNTALREGKGLAQFLSELRDFLNELDCGPFDWAVLCWKTELAIS